MVEMSSECPIDAVPCGFYGYLQREYENISNQPPYPVYKTKYYYPGETVFNPPFEVPIVIDPVSNGDNVRRSYLGFSTQFPVDESLLQMAKRTKKVGVTGKYGTRYGGAIRKIVKKFELQQHAKYQCPPCGKV